MNLFFNLQSIILNLKSVPHRWWWFPESIFSEAGRIDGLFVLMAIITVPFLVILLAGLICFFIAFHHERHPRSVPIRSFGTILPTVFICLILLLIELPMDLYSKGIWSALIQHFPAENESLQIRVFPQQFAWHFWYAGEDRRFGTEDDVGSINILYVPVNTKVVLTLQSQDVLHSFFVPVLRVKQDAVPGQKTRLWFRAEKKGRYEIACAELCGMGHYQMKAQLFVVNQKEFVDFQRNEQDSLDMEVWEKWR